MHGSYCYPGSNSGGSDSARLSKLTLDLVILRANAEGGDTLPQARSYRVRAGQPPRFVFLHFRIAPEAFSQTATVLSPHAFRSLNTIAHEQTDAAHKCPSC